MVDLPKLQSIELGDNVFGSIDGVQEGDGGSQEGIDNDREDSGQEDVGGNQEDIGSHQEESDNNQDESDNAQPTSQNILQPQIILTMKSMFYCILHQRSSCVILIQRRRILFFQLQLCDS